MSFAGDIPGQFRRRDEVPAPAAYVVVDCETTGTDPEIDEIVSFALVRLDGSGMETSRWTRIVRPSIPIPAEATAVHGITDADVADAASFVELAGQLFCLLEDAVFVAHNAPFDLAMLRHGLARVGVLYCPVGVACTLDAFRLLEPLSESHRLDALCRTYGIPLDAHDALSDALATAALLRVLIDGYGVAPETVELDPSVFMRLRSRGDTRPASEPQIRRVFGLARSAGLLLPDGSTHRDHVLSLVERVAGTSNVDELTREQVQDVYDELERMIEPKRRAA
jgi:DNA polymerase III epsilon subunit family exonuclease